MGKIRINELARELEVKAHEILDLLPELGVTEKKTHSSSVDEDTAIKLRRHYGREVSAPPASASERSRSSAPAAVAEIEEDASQPEQISRQPERHEARREEAPSGAQPNGQPKPSQAIKPQASPHDDRRRYEPRHAEAQCYDIPGV